MQLFTIAPTRSGMKEAMSADPEFREVAACVAAAGWPGVALPKVRVLDTTFYPVVEFNETAAARMLDGAQPELSMYSLNMWETWPGGFPGAPATALRLVGSVSTVPVRRAMETVRSMAGFGAGMVIARRRPTVFKLSEADFAGVWVVQTQDSDPEVLVRGRVGPGATARRTTATRFVEETLFAHALTYSMVTPSRHEGSA